MTNKHIVHFQLSKQIESYIVLMVSQYNINPSLIPLFFLNFYFNQQNLYNNEAEAEAEVEI